MSVGRSMFIVRCPADEYSKDTEEKSVDCSTNLLKEEQKTPGVTFKLSGSQQFKSNDSNLSLKIQDILQKQRVRWSSWLKTSCDNYFEVHFCCNEGGASEKMIEQLTEIGIGKISGTGIVVLPVSYSTRNPPSSQNSSKVTFDESSDEYNRQASTGSLLDSKGSRREFIKSIRSRLTVPQVFHSISASSRVTFDYISLVILASIIASLGLRNNSSVVIVASMLISPLMGPILAMVFALTIVDYKLLKLGIKTETIGLFLSVIVGFICGTLDMVVRVLSNNFHNFPTHEMCDRGQLSSLITGIFVALPSGAGVAMSVLGGNIGSLVGVAISASLLPPAVNFGMFLGVSLVAGIMLPRKNETAMLYNSLCSLNGSVILNVDGIWTSKQASILGLTSLLLTLLNIICMLLTGMIVLKIKQVNRKNTFADKFWDDLKITKINNLPVDARRASKVDVQEWASHYGLNVEAERDRNLESSDVRRRVEQFAHDISQINSDLNLITTNIYRYGPATKYDPIFEEMIPALPPKWTDIFNNQSNRSGRFEVVPAESDEELNSLKLA
ncbi:hypothetical protein GJ496_007728 [Pomphorhynchus laevis]|nr:hypothetical protein GJ496_007728 [Pomphorhynchus laevis]